MELDKVYESVPFQLSEMPHDYGTHTHILADPALLTLLTRFCSPDVVQPEANRLLKTMYTVLLMKAMNKYGPKKVATLSTRMSSAHPGAKYHGVIFDPSTSFVVMDLMRAGIFPSHICYDLLHDFVPASQIRQDHIVAARKANKEGQVVGVELAGSKIGGTIRNSILVVPDPMAATGGTILSIIQKYNSEFEGPGIDTWALHLIITPEYIARVQKECPGLKVFAVRCDRGMSTSDVYRSKFGQMKGKEKGLNAHQYIVPGGGGIGEILNNSFV